MKLTTTLAILLSLVSSSRGQLTNGLNGGTFGSFSGIAYVTNVYGNSSVSSSQLVAVNSQVILSNYWNTNSSGGGGGYPPDYSTLTLNSSSAMTVLYDKRPSTNYSIKDVPWTMAMSNTPYCIFTNNGPGTITEIHLANDCAGGVDIIDNTVVTIYADGVTNQCVANDLFAGWGHPTGFYSKKLTFDTMYGSDNACFRTTAIDAYTNFGITLTFPVLSGYITNIKLYDDISAKLGTPPSTTYRRVWHMTTNSSATTLGDNMVWMTNSGHAVELEWFHVFEQSTNTNVGFYEAQPIWTADGNASYLGNGMEDTFGTSSGGGTLMQAMYANDHFGYQGAFALNITPYCYGALSGYRWFDGFFATNSASLTCVSSENPGSWTTNKVCVTYFTLQ